MGVKKALYPRLCRQSDGGFVVHAVRRSPVNGLGLELRQGIQTAYRKGRDDDQVQAIVIASADKLFCGGEEVITANLQCVRWLLSESCVLVANPHCRH